MKQWGRIDQSLTLMGIMLGCGTAFLIWGRFPDAEARLWQQSVHFSRLPPAEQESILESYYSHFQKCTPERQQTLQKIVSAVQQDDVLRDKLQTLDEWFLSLIHI